LSNMDIRLSPWLVGVNVLLIRHPTIRPRHYRRRQLNRRQSPFPALAGNSSTRPPLPLRPWTSLSPFPDTTSSPSTPATSIVADFFPIICSQSRSPQSTTPPTPKVDLPRFVAVHKAKANPMTPPRTSLHATLSPLSIMYLHM